MMSNSQDGRIDRSGDSFAGRMPRRDALRAMMPLSVALAAMWPHRLGAAPIVDEPLCGTCKTKGRIAHDHSPSAVELEKDVTYCSLFFESDSEALGLDWMPCPKCVSNKNNQAAKREFDGEIAKRKEWLKARRTLDEKIGKSAKVCHIETPNFIFTYGIPQIKVGTAVYDLHKGAHLYAKRLEDLRRDFMALHQLTEDSMLKTMKPWLAMLERLRDAKAVCPLLTDLNFAGGQKVFLLGPNRAGMASWDDNEIIRTDEDRYQHFVHTASHFVSHSLKDWHWWLFDKHGWVFEGIGFYWEYRMFGTPVATCYSEQMGVALSAGHIESTIKKFVTGNDIRPLVSLVDKSVSSLDEIDRKFSWSYVDFLIWYDAKAFGKFLNLLLDNNTPTRDCLKQAFDLSFPQVQEMWLAYVRDQYLLIPKKGPMRRSPRGGTAPKGSK